MVNNFEFVANNPGDWIFHCHMVHHMTYPIGPVKRHHLDISSYQKNIPETIDQELTDNIPGEALPKIEPPASLKRGEEKDIRASCRRTSRGCGDAPKLVHRSERSDDSS